MELDADFEATVQAAATDALVAQLRDADAEQLVREGARDALVQAGYEVDAILETLVGPVVDENPLGDADIRIVFGFTHEAARFLEFGTSPHTIEGDPVLSFIWNADDAPEWVAETFEPEGNGFRVFFAEVNVDGVTETRFTRRALADLRRGIRRGV